jgi:hypothetical protein
MHSPRRIGRRSMLVLVGAVAALAWGAAPALAVTEYTEGAEFDESTLADGYDYLMSWNGTRWVQSSRGGLGTLATNTAAANPMATNGLVLLKTICKQFLTSVNVQGKHCFRKYRPSGGDGDPNHFYRLWWVTGSVAAKSGRKLLRVRDGFNTTTAGASFVDWRPVGTTNPGSCFQTTASLGLSHWGISASISTSFTVCPETFGPSYVGDKLFRFHWTGKRSAGNYVGAGGGALYQIPNGATAKFGVGVIAVYCKTSQSGC